MIALPHFSALMIWLAGVAPGLVDGVMAATTPTGRAISVIPRSGCSAITPTVRTPRRSRSSPSVLRGFLASLSAALPRPVSRVPRPAPVGPPRRPRPGPQGGYQVVPRVDLEVGCHAKESDFIAYASAAAP